jgi:hypothetical protein
MLALPGPAGDVGTETPRPHACDAWTVPNNVVPPLVAPRTSTAGRRVYHRLHLFPYPFADPTVRILGDITW